MFLHTCHAKTKEMTFPEKCNYAIVRTSDSSDLFWIGRIWFDLFWSGKISAVEYQKGVISLEGKS